jgi:SAM-dependent methyltransferase
MSLSYKSYLHKIIDDNEEHHFWFKARSRLIQKVVYRFCKPTHDKTFIEIGCGNGKLIRALEAIGLSLTGIDINQQAIVNSRIGTKAILIQKSFLTLKLNKKYNAIGMFDVIEHQTNDASFIKKAVTLIKPGGFVFVTVPAKMSLWNRINILSGHKKRYELNELNRIGKQAGLTTVYINYWQCFGYPVYYIWNKIWKYQQNTDIAGFFKTPPGIINSILFVVLVIEQLFMFSVQYPFGTSLIYVGQKE